MKLDIALYCMKAYSEHHNEMCEDCVLYGQTGTDHCFEDALDVVINTLEKIDKNNGKSASKCFETINLIKKGDIE